MPSALLHAFHWPLQVSQLLSGLIGRDSNAEEGEAEIPSQRGTPECLASNDTIYQRIKNTYTEEGGVR